MNTAPDRPSATYPEAVAAELRRLTGQPWEAVTPGKAGNFQIIRCPINDTGADPNPHFSLDFSDSEWGKPTPRVEVSGGWPRGVLEPEAYYRPYPYPEGRPQSNPITCSESRGPEAIAGDIYKRFLNDYLAAWDYSMEAWRRGEAWQQRRLDDLEEARTFPFVAHTPSPQHAPDWLYFDGLSGGVRALSEGRWSLEATLTTAELRAALEAIKALEEGWSPYPERCQCGGSGFIPELYDEGPERCPFHGRGAVEADYRNGRI